MAVSILASAYQFNSEAENERLIKILVEVKIFCYPEYVYLAAWLWASSANDDKN